MELTRFKDELRARITDFAMTHHLIGMSETKTNGIKKKQAEEAYHNLERWIMENLPDNNFTLPIKEEPIINSEDQQALDF